jgi:hypothetical protein
MPGAKGSEVVPIGTAFVIGQMPDGSALLVTAAHNITERARQRDANLVVLFLKQGSIETGEYALIGPSVAGVSVAQSCSDVALMVVPTNDTVVMPATISLGSEER